MELALGLALLMGIRDCAPDRVSAETCFSISQPAIAEPFSMIHLESQTRATAVLIHGFTDSPYYMKDVAASLYNKGLHVLAIRLTGHGTRPEDLQAVTLDQWKQDVQYGISLARQLGGPILLGGFSTGGALSLWAANVYDREVKGVLLFSPAIQIRDLRAPLTCHGDSWITGPWVRPLQEDNPIRYRKMALNGACQVYRITKEAQSLRGQFQHPVFAAFSERDRLVSARATIGFLRSLPAATTRALIFTPRWSWLDHLKTYKQFKLKKDRDFIHEQIPVAQNPILPDEQNPEFSLMEAEYLQFINQLGLPGLSEK